MGELLRRFWVPALLEEEVGDPDGDPVRVRLMGEDLVAFRDTDGRVGLVDAHCTHRRAPLFFGRNEQCGLRCVYHGWKFDVDGNCLDQPNEPDSTEGFRRKAKLTSYPTQVKAGIVWAYLGPSEVMPTSPPALEWMTLPEGHYVVSKYLQENNWVQAVEGGVDTTHVAFLHKEWDPSIVDGANRALNAADLLPMSDSGSGDENQARGMELIVYDSAPKIHVQQSDFGFWLGCRANTPDENTYYWRITPFQLPFYKTVPPFLPTEVDEEPPPFDGHAWVPIDDTNTWTYNIEWRSDRPFTEDEIEHMRSNRGPHAPSDENFVPYANKRNDYLIDRKLQRTSSYTGMINPNVQDRAMQEMQGAIADRSRERLGRADLAIVTLRAMLLRLAAELAEGKEPLAPSIPNYFTVRSATVLMSEESDFVTAAQGWLDRSQHGSQQV
jgi:phthalate 4,5-dioxygenase